MRSASQPARVIHDDPSQRPAWGSLSEIIDTDHWHMIQFAPTVFFGGLMSNITKSLRAKIAIVFLIGFSLTAAPAVVNAATSYSGWGVYTAGPTSFANRSGISNDGGQHSAAGSTRKSDSTTAPAGWLGSNGRLYYGTALCKQTGIAYNGAPAVSYTRWTPFPACATGPAYGRAESSVYNGNGYTTFSAFSSPNLST